jgi:Cu/Ag efflux pump CusA
VAAILVFLWHIRSALVAIFTLPIAIILSFLPMYKLGVTSNIMSLGGIAIAIGAMVDAAIIMVGKAGQSETSTDPAPLSMIETVVKLKPAEQWRPGMTWEKLLAELNEKIKTPGMANIFWMPIRTRTEMLTVLGYNMSIAVWVGLIALAGLDAETGVVMLLYLDHAWDKFRAAGRMNSMDNLHSAVIEGAVLRIRPKIMTICAILFGLLPIMWSPTTQSGADVMKRIAAPMIGGVLTSGILELLLYPVIYVFWRKRHLGTAWHGNPFRRGWCWKKA